MKKTYKLENEGNFYRCTHPYLTICYRYVSTTCGTHPSIRLTVSDKPFEGSKHAHITDKLNCKINGGWVIAVYITLDSLRKVFDFTPDRAFDLYFTIEKHEDEQA